MKRYKGADPINKWCYFGEMGKIVCNNEMV
jgi:hypothetical protein